MASIRTVDIKKDKDGNYESIRIVFGPHYYLELNTIGDSIKLELGATHHGFKADASEVDGQLEKIINEVRKRHVNLVTD